MSTTTVRRHHTALSALFRSETQGKVLAEILLSPEEASISTIARRARVSRAGAAREVARLHEAGIVALRQDGTSKYIRPLTDSHPNQLIRELVLLTFGPKPVLEEALSPINGISGAYIYGSWAARFHGVPGHHPNDIDVLIVGSPERDTTYDAIDEASKELRQEVNVAFVNEKDWIEASSPFIQQIKKDRQFVALTLSEEPE